MRMVFQYQAGPCASNREITSIDTPGDAANIGGKPITGVSGPSVCDRSTIRRRPAASCSTSCISTDTSSLRGRHAQALQMALELEAVFQQPELRHVAFGSDRLHLRHDG